MYTRVSGMGAVVLMSVFGAVSCGSDEPTAPDSSCVMNEKSVPGTPEDPCPQNAPQCPAPMYAAISTCMPTGKWNTQCDCVLASTVGGGGTTAAAVCGDGMVAATEDCEGNTFVSCATAMPGTTGMAFCNPTTCQWNPTTCMSGGGSGMGGGGNGTAGDGM